MVRRALAFVVLAAACTGAPRPAGTPDAPPPSPPPPPAAASPTSPPASAVVWVAVEDGEAALEVDLRRRRVVSRHPLSGRPHNLTVAADGTVATTLPGRGRVAVIRGRSVREVALGGSPHDVKAAGDLLVVANEGAARLDLLTLRGGRVGEVALPANPHDLAVSPDRRTAWVSLNGSDRLAVVDLRDGEVDRLVDTAGAPHDLLVAPSGDVWVSDWNEGVWILSARGEPRGRVLAGVQIHHLAFAPDGRTVWLTDHAADRVFVVATGRRRVVAEIPLGGAPHHVTLTPDGRWAAVANHDDGTVVAFDARTRRRAFDVEVGPGPHGVWAAP